MPMVFSNRMKKLRQLLSHIEPASFPEDIRYKDINGDGKIDEKDRVRYGYTDVPQVFYGFSLGGSYKGFSLSVLVQGAAKVSKMLSSYTAFAFYNNGNMYEHQRNRWTPENPSVNNPRFTTKAAGSSNNSLSSTYWQRDASYLRLKNVELSYNLPTKVVRSIGLEELRIFLNGQNLLTFDKLDVIDPEALWQWRRLSAPTLIQRRNKNIKF